MTNIYEKCLANLESYLTELPVKKTKTIPLTQGFSATVDEWVSMPGNWCVLRIKNSKRLFYAKRGIKLGFRQYGTQLLHHHVLKQAGIEIPKGLPVDHINGNGLDNRLENLRVVTNSRNHGNQRKPRNNTSGYKGVGWHKKAEKWSASITCMAHKNYLGLFETKEDAARAYDLAAIKYFGDCAFLNFPKASNDNAT